MDWQRNLLIGAIIAVFAVLFVRWNQFQEAHQPPPESFVKESASPAATAGEDAAGIPQAPAAGEVKGIEPVDQPTGSGSRLVTVRTDVLEVTIDTRGGDIVRTALLEHLRSRQDKEIPVVLLNRTQSHTYIAQSGLVGPDGIDTNEERPTFRADRAEYRLGEGRDSVSVELVHEQGGVAITKVFEFKRGQYLVDVRYRIDNGRDRPWQGALFGQILRDDYRPPEGDGVGMKAFVGPALTTPEENYKKLDFDDLRDEPFTARKQGGWVAMLQHYFLSAWVPNQEVVNDFSLRQLGGRDLFAMGFTAPMTTVAPGQTGSVEAQFYAGPKDQYRLEEIAPHLDLTIDYGWLWWVAKPIFALLTFIHGLVGNWGWSIILLTVLIKLAFFKLSATSYRSMAKMRRLQPEMQRLKELYGDDRQKLSQEMMNFYKKEKINPLGGCLPILIQMPVFIALYWVLFESVELRHAPWILWIQDLSAKDPYFVLPVLNGIAMFITAQLQPEPPDPTQAKIMKIMPVAFSFLFALFPAGLVLYWTVNSVLSIAQQWYITRRIESGRE